MALEWSPVTPVPPLSPDSYACDELYGTQLNQQDCIQAAGFLPTGANPVPYRIDATLGLHDSGPFRFPYRISYGQCSVTIEIIGSADMRGRISVVPDIIRGLAGHVINECVADGGVGGFATGGIANMIRYILSPQEHNPGANLASPTSLLENLDPFPQTALYFTVTISRPNPQGRLWETPKLDPNIPLFLSIGIENTWRDRINEGQMTNTIDGLLYASAVMGVDRVVPWYNPSALGIPTASTKDEMTYECDSSLGSPGLVDCSQIEYSQLGPASDTVTVGGPGSDGGKAFMHNTCRVKVEANMAIVLTWEQVGMALGALIHLCVENPLVKPRGGRAFYGTESGSGSASILGGRKRRRKRAVTGLNALPPHVNITISQVNNTLRTGQT